MEWQRINPYCITNGSFNITRSGSGIWERHTLWDVAENPAKVAGYYPTEEEAKKAVERKHGNQDGTPGT